MATTTGSRTAVIYDTDMGSDDWLCRGADRGERWNG